MIWKNTKNKNCTDNLGWTPVHHASVLEDTTILQYLFQAGCQKDPLDDTKSTPLHLAAFSGKFKSVEYLLNQGLRMNLRDQFGRTPLDIAQSERHEDIAELFLSRESRRSKENWSKLVRHFSIKTKF